MNVVIVGLADNRRSILAEISAQCRVVGYADIKKYHRAFDSFDYVPYVEVADLKSFECDFIVIGYTKREDIQAVNNELRTAGGDTDKVIEYQLFKDTLCIDQMKAFENTEHNFDILLFGMSHSQCSIQPQYFTQRLFKFAAPSMDLFCQEKIVRRLISDYTESVTKTKQFVFELPYYIFNFDLSRFRQFVLNRVYYFHSFSDYHHFGEKEGDQELILHFENFVKVFDRDTRSDKFTLNKDADNETSSGVVAKAKRVAHEVLRKREIRHFKDDVWFKNYESTQKENADLWNSIITQIKAVNPNAEITVLVCPFDPMFRKLYAKQIDEKKKQFYSTIGDIKVIDNFELNDDYHFADHCHLRTECGLRYTQVVRKQLGDCEGASK